MNQIKLTREEIKKLAIDCGASDAGIISLSVLGEEQINQTKKIFPRTKALISIAVKYNDNALKSQYRSIANNEYQHVFRKMNKAVYDLENALIERGIEAVATVADFPMETDLNTPISWLISHKEIAIKAGIGKMGLNRLVIHPVHGPYILLSTILINYEPDQYDQESDENPCLDCKLCMDVCPTGSICEEGFNFMGCYTHNYRDMRSSFLDLSSRLEQKNKKLEPISTSEKTALWQSLQYGSNYRCSHCVAVCPASEAERERFKKNKADYVNTYVKPLKEKTETVYVLKGSRADYHLDKFKNKKKKYVSNGMEMSSMSFFKDSLKLSFQQDKAKGISRNYQFIFSGDEPGAVTIKIEQGHLNIVDVLDGKADLKINCDSKRWLRFLSSGKGLLLGILTGKIKITGDIRLLMEFKQYF